MAEDSRTREMRVLLVANTLPPEDISGVGEQVLQLASGLEDRGIRSRFWDAAQVAPEAPKCCSR